MNLDKFSSIIDVVEYWYRKRPRGVKTKGQLATALGYKTPAAATLILARKRTLSHYAFNEFKKRLSPLSSFEVSYLDALYELSKARTKAAKLSAIIKRDSLRKKLKEMRKLSKKQMTIFDNWLAPILLQASTISDFEADERWVMKRCLLASNLNEDYVRSAMRLLGECGFDLDNLSNTENTSDQFVTEDEVKNRAYFEYVLQLLDNFKTLTTELDAKDRHIRCLTISIPNTKIAIAKEKINQFMTNLQAELAGPGPDDLVVQAMAGFVPVLKEKKCA
jgi:uncharacterized protein (TIGR02147 family)